MPENGTSGSRKQSPTHYVIWRMSGKKDFIARLCGKTDQTRFLGNHSAFPERSVRPATGRN